MDRDALQKRLQGIEWDDFEVKEAAAATPEDACAGDHRCSPEEEARFLRDASYETFDSTVCEDATVDDLDPKDIRWFRGVITRRDLVRAHPDLSPSDFLAEIGLLRGDGGVSHAAVLLFGKERLIARVKPAGAGDFRLIHGSFKEISPENRWDDRELCEGNLVQTLRSLFERLFRLCPRPFDMEDNGVQHNAHSPEQLAVREALVNLLVHQDYSDRHRTAKILWFADRVSFENPGDSYSSLPEMLDGGSSQLRNPMLVRLMRQAGFAEQAGTGIPDIIRTWRRAGRVPPEIANDPGRKTYRLFLHWRRLLTSRDESWFAGIGQTVSADEARILACTRIRGKLDATSARLAMGLSTQDVTALLTELVVRRLLILADDGTGVSYRLAEHLLDLWENTEPVIEPVEPVTEPVTEPVEPKIGPSSRERKLLGLIATHPGLRVPQLAQKAGCSTATVKRALKSLKNDGLVGFQGSPRTGGYILVKLV